MEDDVHFILDLMEDKVRYYSGRIYGILRDSSCSENERRELLIRKRTIEDLIDDIREIFDMEGEDEDDI